MKLILAETYRMAVWFALERDWHPQDWRYVARASDLHGYGEDTEVWMLSGWADGRTGPEARAIGEQRRVLEARGATFQFVVLH